MSLQPAMSFSLPLSACPIGPSLQLLAGWGIHLSLCSLGWLLSQPLQFSPFLLHLPLDALGCVYKNELNIVLHLGMSKHRTFLMARDLSFLLPHSKINKQNAEIFHTYKKKSETKVTVTIIMATVCLCTPKFTCYNLDPQIHILKGDFWV